MSGECENFSEHTLDCRCLVDKRTGNVYCKICKNEKIACSCIGRTLDLSRKKKHTAVKVTMDVKDATEMIYWARRYCDGRATYAPSSFNQILKRVRAENESIIMHDTFDQTLTNGGVHWPFAQDGMYDAQNGAFDATT